MSQVRKPKLGNHQSFATGLLANLPNLCPKQDIVFTILDSRKVCRWHREWQNISLLSLFTIKHPRKQGLKPNIPMSYKGMRTRET